MGSAGSASASAGEGDSRKKDAETLFRDRLLLEMSSQQADIMTATFVQMMKDLKENQAAASTSLPGERDYHMMSVDEIMEAHGDDI